MSWEAVDVLLVGGEHAPDQRELVESTVVPRLARWCNGMRLRVVVRTVRAIAQAGGAARIELQLPVRERSRRVPLADQIHADLCAAVAARFPARIADAGFMPKIAPPPMPPPRPPLPPPPPPTTYVGAVPMSPSPSGRMYGMPPPVAMPPARRPPTLYLVIHLPGQTSVGRRLSTHRATLGRSDKCDVVIEDSAISRMHAALEVTAVGEVVVSDLGSSNGLLVNGNHVSMMKLQPGDMLQLGAARVEVRW